MIKCCYNKKKTSAILICSVFLLSVLFSVFCAGQSVAAEEITISQSGVSDVSGSRLVQMSNGEYITLYYYFTTHDNIWPFSDTVDCKLDVEGNSVECAYDLDFDFYEESKHSKNSVEQAHGNNNYWTMWAASHKTTRVTIKGTVTLGGSTITIDLNLSF